MERRGAAEEDLNPIRRKRAGIDALHTAREINTSVSTYIQTARSVVCKKRHVSGFFLVNAMEFDRTQGPRSRRLAWLQMNGVFFFCGVK